MSLAGDYVDIKMSIAATAGIDSGAAGAGAAVNGTDIDLQPSSGFRYRRCLAFGGARTYHKSATQSMSYALSMSHRQTLTGTGSTWANYATGSSPSAKSVTATASGTSYETVEAAFDLRSANRYVRVNLTPTCSTTATGMIYHQFGGVVLTDLNRLPTTG